MEEKKYYVAQANDNGVAYLGLKKGKRYILTPWGEDIWIVFIQGSTVGVGKTDCFEITSFELIKKPMFLIGETVMMEREGIVRDIEIDSSNSCYYTIEDKNGEVYHHIRENSIKSI